MFMENFKILSALTHNLKEAEHFRQETGVTWSSSLDMSQAASEWVKHPACLRFILGELLSGVCESWGRGPTVLVTLGN